MSWLFKVLEALGMVVDKAVPTAVGDRTKISVVVAVAAPIVSKLVCSVYAPACPFIALAGTAAAALVPVFAAAGLVRK